MNYWHRQERRNEIYENGVPVSVPEFEGWTFYVRPLTAWNQLYVAAAARIAQANPEIRDYLKRVEAIGYLPTDEDAALDRRMKRMAFVEGCLVGWEGVTDRNGNLVTPEGAAANEVLAFFPGLLDYLDRFASDVRNFPQLTDDQKADIASGNSKAVSSSASGRGGKRSKS